MLEEVPRCASSPRAKASSMRRSCAGWAAVRSRPTSRRTFGPHRRFSATVRAGLDLSATNHRTRSDGSIFARTLFIISSKSGTTTEPNAFYAYFHEKVSKQVGAAAAGKHFAAITDPNEEKRPKNVRSGPTSRTIRTSGAGIQRSRSSASRRRQSPATTSTCCSTARSARCTPTTAPWIRATPPACVSARRSAALHASRPR